MSFIYDDEALINNLVKCGQNFEKQFSKMAQVGPSPEQAKLGLSLLDDLENAPLPGEPIISSDLPGSSDLIDMQLESLGTLIRFLALSKIMVNYKRIAFEKNDPQAPKNDKSYELYSLSANAFFAAENQDIPQFDFYINKDLLQQYLVSLQATAHKDENKFLENRLKGLIDEARKNGIKIDPNYKPPAKPGEKPAADPAAAQNLAIALDSLLRLLPLHRDVIDFTRIGDFFTEYKKFLSSSDPTMAASTQANIAEAERLISTARGMTVPEKTAIPMNTSYDQISYSLGKDWPRKFLPYIEELQRIVTLTGDVINQLYIKYGMSRSVSDPRV
jgi:hypothetical protein